MSAQEIDDYLAAVREPHRSTLQEMRRRIMAELPDAEQGLSYAVPVFKVHGKPIAGLAAFKNHLSYLPHSGSVLPALSEQLTGYTRTKGALHFAVDTPLPVELIRLLVDTKLQLAGLA
jgi:uncharacterized protein YdhG (YjbR/CyaY superfamily)